VRVDLSEQLVHLTHGTLQESVAAFRSIVAEEQLRGSSNGVRGGHKVVCFSEAPIDVLAKLFSSTAHNFRYRPFGVMVSKAWLFARGGRPVIYQPEAESKLLPAELQHRHVRLDEPGSDRDFTFEREWRIATDALKLEPHACTLIVPDREWDYKLRQEHDEKDMRKARLLGMNPFTRISAFEWHILALCDLGARFPLNDDAP
jgi:hypothetical protein